MTTDADFRLLEFTHDLPRASSAADLERRYLADVASVIPLPMHGIYVFDPDTLAVQHYAATNVSDVFLSRYERVGRTEDPIIARVTGEHRVGYSLQVRSPREWLESTVYREVFSLHRMVHAAQAPVMVDGRLVGTLAFGSDEDRAPLTPAELARIELVARAFGIALDAVRRMERLARSFDQAMAALDLCATPIAMTGETGEAPQLNRAAQRLLDRTVEGRDLLYGLIARARYGQAAFTREARVRWTDGGEGVLRADSRAACEGDARLITTLSCEGAPPPLASPRWAALTEREREVTALVARGLTDAEIARELMLSPHTVRQYVKAILRKVGARSRVTLTALAMAERP